ncbi:MAG: hypothetical protein J0H09_23265, partial [Burkholderiales bacterium]|nr:hypothetical protein [Burkholderiales bacterium]
DVDRHRRGRVAERGQLAAGGPLAIDGSMAVDARRFMDTMSSVDACLTGTRRCGQRRRFGTRGGGRAHRRGIDARARGGHHFGFDLVDALFGAARSFALRGQPIGFAARIGAARKGRVTAAADVGSFFPAEQRKDHGAFLTNVRQDISRRHAMSIGR